MIYKVVSHSNEEIILFNMCYIGDDQPVFRHVTVLSAETDGDHTTNTVYIMEHDENVCFVMAKSFVIVSYGCFNIDDLPDGYPWSVLFDCDMRLTEVLQNDYVMILGEREALEEVITMSQTYEELYAFNTAPLQRYSEGSLTPPGSPRSEQNRRMITRLIWQTSDSTRNPNWTQDERIFARTVNEDLRRVIELDLQNLASTVTSHLLEQERLLMEADTEPEQDSDIEE